MKATQYYVQHRKLVSIVLGFFIVAILAVIDELTGHKIHISFIYVVPIVVAAWFIGRWAGVYMAILSAMAWLLVDIRSELNYAIHIHFSNAVIRLAFFIFITHGIYLLAAAKHRQDELTSFIIHDLKAPLTNIITGLTNIRDVSGPLSDDVRDHARMALISSGRMLNLINSIIDVSKLESGNFIARSEDVDVNSLVDRALESVSIWARRNFIKLDCRIETKFGNFRTDPALVERVLVNLLSNAVKVSSPNSTVEISVRDGEDEKKLCFSVSDQGPGIDPKWQKKIFDKYYQVEARKGGANIGSGLGLTFCRLTVMQLGGRISLQSEVGKGTTISFDLPI